MLDDEGVVGIDAVDIDVVVIVVAEGSNDCRTTWAS